jgi:VWFA-related protein
MIKLIVAFAACTVLAAQTPQIQQPVFRSGATLVPLDVRVLDKNGKPITDLKQDEFVVTEDGKPQAISHFFATPLAPLPAAGTPGLLRAAAAQEALAPQTRRVFLLVMGRGRLQPPSRGVDAMLQFVRERVLPQDQVAVLAWNRATDFTTDHERLADLLERFKIKHEAIEAKLAAWFRGLVTVYGDRAIPPAIQKQIDDVFDVAGLRAAHTIVADANANLKTNDPLRKQADDLLRAETVLGRIGNPLNDGIDPVEVAGLEGGFYDALTKTMTATQDISNLYAAIEYLRFIDGEKHVVFVTETGLGLPTFAPESALAAAANNARVVVDTIQTGGNTGDVLVSAASGGVPPMLFGPGFKLQSLRELSRQTGGVVSIYDYADNGARRIDEATRFAYLLGYYANGAQDGSYRRIDVKVTRPGAEVLFRHGYYARPQTLPPDRRAMTSYTRISTALMTSMDVYDIPLGFRTRDELDGQNRVLAMDLSIGLEKLSPVRTPQGRQYSVELAIVCANGDHKPVGQHSQRLNLTVPEELYQRTLKDGVPATVTVRIPVTSFPIYVKAVVYHFESDLLGSIVKKIR